MRLLTAVCLPTAAALGLFAGFCGCASTMPRADPAVVDALLDHEGALLLLNFAEPAYQKWVGFPGPEAARRRMADRNRWLALPVPERPFLPVRAAAGRRGHFILLDRAGRRLCRYDGSAQLVSCLPLPATLRQANLDKLDLFATSDGAFTFLDRSRGRAWSFVEVPSHGQSGQLQLRQSADIPLGLGTCVAEPNFPHICCGKDGDWVCFDAYFNHGEARPAAYRRHGALTRPGLAGGDLYFRLQSAAAWPDTVGGICYYPDRKTFSACPEGGASPTVN